MTATEPLTTKSDTEKITSEILTSVGCAGGGGDGGDEGVVGGKTGGLRRVGVLRHVRSLVSASVLKELLLRHGFDGWATWARVRGLMLLLDYVVRCSTGKGRCGSLKSGVPVSCELARSFVSPLRRAAKECPSEPLDVLVTTGLLERVFTGLSGYYCESSRYRITERYLPMVKRRFRVRVTPGRLRKLESWRERYVKRLGGRLPFLRPLIRDLQTVTLSDEGRLVVTELLAIPGKAQAVTVFIRVLQCIRPTPRITRTGTVVTFVSSCPRELKPYLLLAGEPVALCDVSSAHWALVHRVALDWVGGSVDAELGRELERYRASFDNDFYLQFCKHESERDSKKKLLNVLLNSTLERCNGNGLWRYFAVVYPRIARIIESIKRDDHRQICHRLQRYTAQATNSALYELQQRQIGCVPDTDSLIVPYSHHEVACEVLKRHFREVSRGVDVKVKVRSVVGLSNALPVEL